MKGLMLPETVEDAVRMIKGIHPQQFTFSNGSLVRVEEHAECLYPSAAPTDKGKKPQDRGESPMEIEEDELGKFGDCSHESDPFHY